MRVRNNGSDRTIFGLHFAEMTVVDVPETLEPAKREYIARQFEVIKEAPIEVQNVEPETLDDIFVAPEPDPETVSLDVEDEEEDEPEIPRRRAAKRPRK